ncbi:MAG TPA: pitrilysin family protein [candidate division Zixibacteria bacterium]|nr:pitrilysin family protein [candidate division Zixibacteria bacterium]
MPDNSFPGPETVHRFELDNGITVLIYENAASQSIIIDGIIRAGALVESRETAGLANYTADMLLRGTKKRSFDMIFEEVEAVGASVDFGAGRHVSDFFGSCLAEDLDLILGIIADSLRQPVFPENQVEKVRGEIITGLHIRANDTGQMAGLHFRELLYKDHPYGKSSEGYLDSIQRLNRDALAEYHEQFFGPKGMIITLVGAIEPKSGLALVQKAFGDWDTGQLIVPSVPGARRPSSRIQTHHEMPDKTQTDIMLGVPGPLRAADDYLEASMANTILGVFGMYGRLGQNVRESQGLAYYSFSRLAGGLGPSPWYVSTGVSPDNVDLALDSIFHEIERIIEEPVTEEELADSQAFRTGALPVSLETNQGVANILTDIELFDLGLDYLHRLPEKIFAMTPETVQAAARHYLSSEEIAIAIAGP